MMMPIMMTTFLERLDLLSSSFLHSHHQSHDQVAASGPGQPVYNMTKVSILISPPSELLIFPALSSPAHRITFPHPISDRNLFIWLLTDSSRVDVVDVDRGSSLPISWPGYKMSNPLAQLLMQKKMFNAPGKQPPGTVLLIRTVKRFPICYTLLPADKVGLQLTAC